MAIQVIRTASFYHLQIPVNSHRARVPPTTVLSPTFQALHQLKHRGAFITIGFPLKATMATTPDSHDDITLFSTKLSPFASRVRVALREKKIPYHLVTVDYKNKPRELLDANPYYATVPTLIHNGTPILESAIILEYLEDAFPQNSSLMPADPILRSKVRFYTDYIYKNFPVMRAIAKTGNAAVMHMPGWVRKLDEIMVEFSPEGPFFMGSEFTHLDVVLAPLIYWRIFLEDVLGVKLPAMEEVPRFGKWVAAAKARESVKAEIYTPEEGKEALNARLELLKQINAPSQAGNGK